MFPDGILNSYSQIGLPLTLFGRGTERFKLDESTSNFFCCLDLGSDHTKINQQVVCNSLDVSNFQFIVFLQPMHGGWHAPLWSARNIIRVSEAFQLAGGPNVPNRDIQ